MYDYEPTRSHSTHIGGEATKNGTTYLFTFNDPLTCHVETSLDEDK